MESYNIKQVVPFFMVTNILHSLKFYVDGLGFHRTNSWEPNGKLTWCWLQREGAALMLQEYRPNDPLQRLARTSLIISTSPINNVGLPPLWSST